MSIETTTSVKIDKPIVYYANKDIIPEPMPGKTWRWNDVSGWKAIKDKV